MRTLHNIKIPLSSDKHISKLKRKEPATTNHGNKIWNSSLLMIDYLSRYNLQNFGTALDIGCGWGLVSTYLYKHGIETVGLDIDKNTKPYLDYVAQINHVMLDVIYEDFLELPVDKLSAVDLIVGCDICYWDNHVDKLVELGNNFKGTILIADPGRETFWELCKQVNGNLHDQRIQQPRKVHGYVLEINNK